MARSFANVLEETHALTNANTVAFGISPVCTISLASHVDSTRKGNNASKPSTKNRHLRAWRHVKSRTSVRATGRIRHAALRVAKARSKALARHGRGRELYQPNLWPVGATAEWQVGAICGADYLRDHIPQGHRTIYRATTQYK